MGLNDRDYGRDPNGGGQPGIHLGARGPLTLTTKLVMFTFSVYLLQLLTTPADAQRTGNFGWVTHFFSLYTDTLTRPWQVFEFLTYGFLHSPTDFWHILGNMFGLWMFGRTVEQRYGKREYLNFYLAAIVFAGAAWYVSEFLAYGLQAPAPTMLGASGGLSAVLILFALNFPRQQIYLYGIIGIPAWLFALFFVGSDLMGAMDRTSKIACTAHLGGALFAVLYFRFGWKISPWIPSDWSLPRPRKGPKLRIHEPSKKESALDQQVDALLKKIKEQGQDSLTASERRTLEKASREYRRKESEKDEGS